MTSSKILVNEVTVSPELFLYTCRYPWRILWTNLYKNLTIQIASNMWDAQRPPSSYEYYPK